MSALPVVAMAALAEVVRKVQAFKKIVLKRRSYANESSLEQGVTLEGMDGDGLRNRLGAGQTSGGGDESPESPTSNSTASGTMTPGSVDDSSDSEGK